jgi:hypothetical protein
MQTMSLEKTIQKSVIDYARKNDFISLKVNVGAQRGWPDYLLVDPEGWHVWIEFKKPGKEPDPLQAYRALQLTERGVAVLVVDSKEKGISYVDQMVAARLPKESDEDSSSTGERRIILGPGTGED